MYEQMDACNARLFDSTNSRKQAVSQVTPFYSISQMHISVESPFASSSLPICQFSNAPNLHTPYCNSVVTPNAQIGVEQDFNFNNGLSSYESYNIGFPQVLDYHIEEKQQLNSVTYQCNSFINPNPNQYLYTFNFCEEPTTFKSINIINQPLNDDKRTNFISTSSSNDEIFASVINEHQYNDSKETIDYQELFTNLAAERSIFSPRNEISSLQVNSLDQQFTSAVSFSVESRTITLQKPKTKNSENKKGKNSNNSAQISLKQSEKQSQTIFENKPRLISRNMRSRKVSSSPSLEKVPSLNSVDQNADIELDKKPIVNYQKPSHLITKSGIKEDAKVSDKNECKNDNKKFYTSVKSRIRGRR